MFRALVAEFPHDVPSLPTRSLSLEKRGTGVNRSGSPAAQAAHATCLTVVDPNATLLPSAFVLDATRPASTCLDGRAATSRRMFSSHLKGPPAGRIVATHKL